MLSGISMLLLLPLLRSIQDFLSLSLPRKTLRLADLFRGVLGVTELVREERFKARDSNSEH